MSAHGLNFKQETTKLENVKAHVNLMNGDTETGTVITMTETMAEKQEGRQIVGSTRVMGEQGDVIVVWTDDKDTQILESIQKKLDAGYTFFIVESRAWGILPPKKTQITDVKKQKKAILGTRTIEVRDVDFDALLNDGKVGVTTASREGGEIETIKRAETAEEVVKNDTVAVPQRKGG